MTDPKSTNSSSEKLPLRKALLWIAVSVFLISGSCALGLLYYQHVRDKQKFDSAYRIVAIVQTSPHAEGLRTVYLAELLNLSIDLSTNLYRFDSKEARKKLLNSPVIKEASVRKIRPGTVHIDYTLRQPIAFIGDYTNTAMDAERVPFPFKPFFTPKKLPEIYLGEDDLTDQQMERNSEITWGIPLRGRRIELAEDLLHLVVSKCIDEYSNLIRIDVSKAFALSYGQKQIVLVFEDRIQRLVDGRPITVIHPRIIRLNPEDYSQQLANYLVLRNYLRQKDKISRIELSGSIVETKPTVIDLRLSELAFIALE